MSAIICGDQTTIELLLLSWSWQIIPKPNLWSRLQTHTHLYFLLFIFYFLIIFLGFFLFFNLIVLLLRNYTVLSCSSFTAFIIVVVAFPVVFFALFDQRRFPTPCFSLFMSFASHCRFRTCRFFFLFTMFLIMSFANCFIFLSRLRPFLISCSSPIDVVSKHFCCSSFHVARPLPSFSLTSFFL